MTQVSIIWDVWDPLRLHLNPKYLKSGKKRLSYGQFTNGRLRDSSDYHGDVWDSLGLHLNQKDLKLGKKWLSYGLITNGRLSDSSKYHVGCKVSIRASFEPKRSKIRQETAELLPFYQWEVALLKRVSCQMNGIH